MKNLQRGSPASLKEIDTNVDAREAIITMAERLEMAVPKRQCGEIVFVGLAESAFAIIVVFFTILAIINLFFQVATIASCIWLAIVVIASRITYKHNGGCRQFLINHLGVFARKQFVESIPQDTDYVEIRYGYQLFGHRLYYFSVPLDKIETVVWHHHYTVDDLSVLLWCDDDDPEKSQGKQKLKARKPDHGIYLIGPPRSTEPFGLAFVEFLRSAGATLVQGEDNCTFVQATSETQKHEEHPAT